MGAFTIYRRELAGLFLSPLAWIVLLVALFLNGVFFLGYMKLSGGDVSTSLEFALGGGWPFWALMVFLPPLLTMRLISEEGRSGTLEFLLTAPVTDAAVIHGKFLAATSFMAVLWLSVPVYALAIRAVGVAPDWGALFGGYLGAILCSGLFVAIGLFASTLTNTPLLAAFLAFMACLGWLLLPFLAGLLMTEIGGLLARWTGGIQSAQRWVDAALERMHVTAHFERSFLRGIFDTAEVVFFLAWTLFFLFLTVRMLEARRWRG